MIVTEPRTAELNRGLPGIVLSTRPELKHRADRRKDLSGTEVGERQNGRSIQPVLSALQRTSACQPGVSTLGNGEHRSIILLLLTSHFSLLTSRYTASMKNPPARLRLVLPLPPSINRQYATVGNRRVLTKDAREFKRDVKKTIDQALLSGKVATSTERELQKALIGVYLTFYFETPKRRDLDGGLKIALDAICVPLGIDDRSVVDLHLINRSIRSSRDSKSSLRRFTIGRLTLSLCCSMSQMIVT